MVRTRNKAVEAVPGHLVKLAEGAGGGRGQKQDRGQIGTETAH